MIYRFGDFQVDTGRFQLQKLGVAVAIEPKVFDLLVFLIENRERMVSRQEIFGHIWEGRIVTDTSLSTHIKIARKALDDDGQRQQVIKTVVGRGYQFIAEIEVAGYPERTAESASIRSQSNSDKSIAVLAFSDLSPDQDQEYFSDGISEELLNLLSKIPDLRVISRTSSFSFKGKDDTVKEIGEQLNVTHVLEGSVRRSGLDLRITAQLIEVADDSHLWSETYDRKMGDVFEVQDDIALTVTKQLKRTLMDAPAKSTSVDAAAYALFLKANYSYQQFNQGSVAVAKDLLAQSIAIAADYAPSWCLLSKVLYRAASHFNQESAANGLTSSKEAVEKALEIDDNFAPAWAQLSILEVADRRFVESREAIKQALSLDDKSAPILATAAGNALDLGQLEEAVQLLHRAIDLDPLADMNHYDLGIAYLWLDRLDEASAAIKMYDHFRPDAAIQHCTMSSILLHQGKLKESLQEADKEPHAFWKLFAKTNVIYSMGKQAEADHMLQQFESQYGATKPASVACLYAHRQATDQAFLWLDKAFHQRDENLSTRLNFTQFKILHHDPRWKELLVKMGFPGGRRPFD